MLDLRALPRVAGAADRLVRAHARPRRAGGARGGGAGAGRAGPGAEVRGSARACRLRPRRPASPGTACSRSPRRTRTSAGSSTSWSGGGSDPPEVRVSAPWTIASRFQAVRSRRVAPEAPSLAIGSRMGSCPRLPPPRLEESLPQATRRNALLVYPRFEGTSFWNYQATCELLGARYSAAPLGLITVAALLPQDWDGAARGPEHRGAPRGGPGLGRPGHDRRDAAAAAGRAARHRDGARARQAGGGGRPRRHLLARRSTPRPTSGCSGEAEEIMADFVAAWRGRGRERHLRRRSRFPDVTRSPVPRFDLLKLDHYLHVGVQYSRGCPFDCEFCNVIDLNGRVPARQDHRSRCCASSTRCTRSGTAATSTSWTTT